MKIVVRKSDNVVFYNRPERERVTFFPKGLKYREVIDTNIRPEEFDILEGVEDSPSFFVPQQFTYTPEAGWTVIDADAYAEALDNEPDYVASQESAAEKKATNIVLKEQIAAKLEDLPDEDTAELSYLFDRWSGESVSYVIGDVVRVKNTPYRCVQAHTSQPTFTPDATPALWTPLRNTTGDNPDPWVQPTGAQDAYQTGDRVVHDNPNDSGNIWIYESAIDANTTEPGRDGNFDRFWTPIEVVAG